MVAAELAGQLDIFERIDFPRARNADPRSSHEAAAAIKRSGAAKAQASIVLEALKRYPMASSAELAQFAGLDRYMVARRLPELHQAHLVNLFDPTDATEPCRVSRKRVCRWMAA